MEHPLIERNPEVMNGKPVIKDTRLTVELILERLADGFSNQELLDNYPRLTQEGIQAALNYAADLVHIEATKEERAAS